MSDAARRARDRGARGRSVGRRKSPCVHDRRTRDRAPARDARRDPSLHDAREHADMGRVRTKTVKKVRVESNASRAAPATARAATATARTRDAMDGATMETLKDDRRENERAREGGVERAIGRANGRGGAGDFERAR